MLKKEKETLLLLTITAILLLIISNTYNATAFSSNTSIHDSSLDLKKMTKALGMQKNSNWPEGYIGFEFQIIGENSGYFIVKVVKVHGLSEVKIGNTYHLAKPQKLIKCIMTKTPPAQKLVFIKKLGEITVNDQKYSVFEVRPQQETGTFPISGTVSPGYVNAHGYHYLLTGQRVDITCNWKPTSQPIYLGLIYWAYGHFYCYKCYNGYAEVSMYPPYEGWYSIGVGNPQENTNDIEYDGYYTLNPAE